MKQNIAKVFKTTATKGKTRAMVLGFPSYYYFKGNMEGQKGKGKNKGQLPLALTKGKTKGKTPPIEGGLPFALRARTLGIINNYFALRADVVTR